MKKICSMLFITICVFSFSLSVKAGEDSSFSAKIPLPDSTGVIYELDNTTVGICENPLYTTEESCKNNHSFWLHVMYDNTSGPHKNGTKFLSLDYLNPLPSNELLVNPDGIKCTKSTAWNEPLKYAVATAINYIFQHQEYRLCGTLAISDFVYDKTGGLQGVNLEDTDIELSNKAAYDTFMKDQLVYPYSHYLVLSIDEVTLNYDPINDVYVGTATTQGYKKDYYEIEDVKVNVEGATVTVNEPDINISIPGSAITEKTEIEVSMKVYGVGFTNEYICSGTYGGKPYASIIPIDWERSYYTTSSKTKIGPDKVSFTIEKLDQDEEPLADATLHLESSDGSFVDEFTDQSKDFILDFNKTYYLTETQRATGYKEISKIYEIVVDSEGKITVDGVETDGLLSVMHEITEVNVKDQSEVDGSQIENATLKITNGGSDIACTIQKSDGSKENLTTCEWETGEEPTLIVGLEPGNYELSQTVQPIGYERNLNKINFKLNSDGTITDSEDSTLTNVVITNDYTKLIVDVLDSVTTENIKGAKLSLVDENKDPMSCYVLKNGENVLLPTCEWVSEEDSTIILALEPGTYYLQETDVPDEYELNTKTFNVSIDSDGKSVSIEIINDKKVDVPNTFKNSSKTLLIIAVISILFGNALIIYSKRIKPIKK